MLIRRPALPLLLLVGIGCTRPADAGPGEARGRALVLAAEAGVPSAPIYDPCPAPPAKCLIMPLGDSLTYGSDGGDPTGYRGELFRLLQATGRPFDFVGSVASGGVGSGQEGHPGGHINTLNLYMDAWIPEYKPHVLLIMLGTNDIDLNYPLALETYAKVLDHIPTLVPNSLLAVALIPTNAFDPATTLIFNTALADLVNTRIAMGRHMVLVDMHSIIRSRDISDDTVHPNKVGHTRIAQGWYTVLGPIMLPSG